MIPVAKQSSMLPLSFPVTIVVIKQQATVLKDLSDVSCYRYKVKFEDGTQGHLYIGGGRYSVVCKGE
ncbi:MAG: hypothetical protein WDO19_30350 [Bacteroidota bacterium]